MGKIGKLFSFQDKKKLFVLFAVLFVIFVFYYFDFGKHFSLDSVKKNGLILKSFTETDYIKSVFIFSGIYILLTCLALPFAVFLTIFSGWLFGAFAGAIYSCLSATIGSTIALLLFKFLAGDFLRAKFKHRLERFRERFNKNGYSYLLSIHFSGMVPLFFVNILASLADVKTWTFCWTTAVGTFPAFLVYAFAGKQFNTINNIRDVFTVKILLAFLALALLVLMPTILRKFFRGFEDDQV